MYFLPGFVGFIEGWKICSEAISLRHSKTYSYIKLDHDRGLQWSHIVLTSHIRVFIDSYFGLMLMFKVKILCSQSPLEHSHLLEKCLGHCPLQLVLTSRGLKKKILFSSCSGMLVFIYCSFSVIQSYQFCNLWNIIFLIFFFVIIFTVLIIIITCISF